MSTPTLTMIPTNKIVAGEDNPRGAIDEASSGFKELCASIKARGILQPILVGPAHDGKHALVAGHRRHAAARKAKLAEIPAMVLDLEGAELLAALTENIQREDLSPVAEAQAIHQLQERHGFTQVQAGEALSKSERWVRERLRLLRMPERTQKAYDGGALPLESLVTVEKVAEAAPQVSDALAEASESDEWVRQAVGGGRTFEALNKLAQDAAEKPQEDGSSELGCLVELTGFNNHHRVGYEALKLAGAPAERLEAIAERIEVGEKLRKKSQYYFGHFHLVTLTSEDVDAANSYGCLMSIDGYRYITDAEWLADRFAERLEEAIAAAEKQLKDGRKPKPEKGSPEDEKAAKEERRRQREAEQRQRDEARVANLELGQRTERALRNPKLSLEEAKLLALMAVGDDATELGSRGLIYCYHDYQDEQLLKNGTTKVTYEAGRSAGEDLVKAIGAAKKPEEALGLALRALLLSTYANQDCVAPSSRCWWQVHVGHGMDTLLDRIADKRSVLPDSVREARELERRLAAEEDEITLLSSVKASRAKEGMPLSEVQAYSVASQTIDAALSSKWIKSHTKGELSFTITAAGKKRLEKLQAAEKERQAAK